MLDPFVPLLTQADGPLARLPLPPALQSLYGELAFPRVPDRPYVISNFVATLDGVVSLGLPGQSGGGPISGFNQHDRALMGLLRAASAAVIVGAGTLRAVPRHLWTAEYVFPDLSDAFQSVRRDLGLGPTPLNVIVSASGDVDLSLPVFASGTVSTLLVTSPPGAARLRAHDVPSTVTVLPITGPDAQSLTAASILAATTASLGQPSPLILLEGGPRLMGDFVAGRLVDELFLTLAPQIAGRDNGPGLPGRPGLVTGHLLAPDQPAWSTLLTLHQASSHLFLRYRLNNQI